MKPYPAYKDSGVEWIGQVPVDWNIVPIRALCYLGRGRVISNEEIANNLGEYPVYSSQTAEDGMMGKLNTYDFDGEYVTWTTDGANAGTVFYRKGKFNCTNVCGTLKAKAGKVFLKYLPYVLNLGTKCHVRYDINPKLMNNEMAGIRIPLPMFDEQKDISNYLDRKTAWIDDLIAKKERMIELLKEERTAIINQAVTKGLPPAFMFDTNAFDRLLDEDSLPFETRILITHIQRDQVSVIPSGKTEKKKQLLSLLHVADSISTSVAVWDVSRWDECCWGSDANNALYQKIEKRNGPQDALIAVTAIDRSLTLVTDDKNLSQDINDHGGQAITFDEFAQGSLVGMKDSGIEWLGEIPKHWAVKRLKYLVNGRLEYGANEVAELNDISMPRYIRITDFDEDGCLRDDTFKSLSEDIAREYLLKEGDVLFARSGATVGKTFQFKDYKGKACFAGYLIKASPNAKMLSDFLYYFTKTNAYENWKNSIFNQATIQNIGADKYSMLPLSIPSIKEQKEIVDFIQAACGRIDGIIIRGKKSVELLKEYRTALISEAVTGKMDVSH